MDPDSSARDAEVLRHIREMAPEVRELASQLVAAEVRLDMDTGLQLVQLAAILVRHHAPNAPRQEWLDCCAMLFDQGDLTLRREFQRRMHASVPVPAATGEVRKLRRIK